MKSLIHLLLFVFLNLAANAQNLIDTGIGVTGAVRAIVQKRNMLYLGGSFAAFGVNAAYGNPFDLSSAAPELKFAKPNGSVRSAVQDPGIYTVTMRSWSFQTTRQIVRK